MYQSDLLNFTVLYRLAVLFSVPSYFVGVSLLTTVLGCLCLLIFNNFDNFALD